MLSLLLFYLLFFGAAMVLPTVRVWKRTGINPLVLPTTDDAEGFIGRLFKAVIAVLGAYLLLASLGFNVSAGKIALPEYCAVIGWALMAASLVWVVVAQFQMGQSWRIGIDSRVKTELVANGLFRISRNPIFFGMMIQIIGLFLILSNAVTLAVLVAAYILISIQIRLEEAHLSALHGEAYSRYCNAVRRWI